jgi:formate C-acetyltransferase
MKPDGSDGVNELTFLMLKTAEMLALREPNVGARWHKESPLEYRRALVKSIYRTGAAPALYNDEEIITALTENGVVLEDARDYGIVGCVETTSAGRTMGMTGAIMFNLAAVLELTLNDGVHPLSGSRIGPGTGRLADFRSYEEFFNAFERQLGHMVDLAVEGNNRFAEAHAVLHPTPLLSALIEGTFKSGKDVTRGGAAYNSSGVGVVGLADVADSLSALKQLVFEEKLVSREELSEALKDDFAGHDKTRALLLNKAPKYGTDDPAADEVAAGLVKLVNDTFARHTNPRGGRYHIGYWSVTMHAGNFAYTGSLPNGRPKGTPLASGATPVSGVAIKGPTASLLSTAKLHSGFMANCIANNHKFSRNMFQQPGKLELFEKLVDGYFKTGGMQVQFNVHNKETLLNAQKNPDDYRDLLVRVSGYSAYFCDLNRQMQNEIIARTENSL